MEPQLFPPTLLALPLGYLLAVALGVLIDRKLSPHVALSKRAVIGAIPPTVIGIGAALITAPEIGLRAGLAYMTVATALWFGMALRGQQWLATVPAVISLCGTWVASGNTATGVVAVVSVASLPVVALGFHLGSDDGSEDTTTSLTS